MEIQAGDCVEVSSNEDGFLGSYFLARVLGRLGKGNKKKFRVEYKTLWSDEAERQLLKETVEAYLVRPAPPEIRVWEFNVLDKVDAYDRDGWWMGRVTGKDGFNYSVYFDSSGDELVYTFDNLRPHQEYENGHWILSQKKGYQILPL